MTAAEWRSTRTFGLANQTASSTALALVSPSDFIRCACTEQRCPCLSRHCNHYSRVLAGGHDRRTVRNPVVAFDAVIIKVQLLVWVARGDITMIGLTQKSLRPPIHRDELIPLVRRQSYVEPAAIEFCTDKVVFIMLWRAATGLVIFRKRHTDSLLRHARQHPKSPNWVIKNQPHSRKQHKWTYGSESRSYY